MEISLNNEGAIGFNGQHFIIFGGEISSQLF